MKQKQIGLLGDSNPMLVNSLLQGALSMADSCCQKKPIQNVFEFKRCPEPDDLLGWFGGTKRREKLTKKTKKKEKCGLPGCQILSDKDYCCAEHCKEHRALQKNKFA